MPITLLQDWFMLSPNCDLIDYIMALVLSNGEQKGQIFQYRDINEF